MRMGLIRDGAQTVYGWMDVCTTLYRICGHEGLHLYAIGSVCGVCTWERV